MLQTARPT